MKADDYWRFFAETGDIIYYLLYRGALSQDEETAAKAG